MLAWFKRLIRRDKKQVLCSVCQVKIQSEDGASLHQDVHSVQEELPDWATPTKIVVSPEEFDRIVRFIQNSSAPKEALEQLLRQDDKTWKN